MKRTLLAPLALVMAAMPAAAQDATPKISGLLQVWYTQMMDSDLRHDSLATTNGHSYYDLSGNWTENGFLIRRSEIHVSGNVPGSEGFTYEFNIDPSINTGTSNPTILQDATISYKNEGFGLTMGQFKNQRTYEGLVGSSTLIFAERSQLGRRLGDKRDRGVAASYMFGDQDFGAKLTGAVFNGMTDATSGKTNDTNAQKDFVGRLDFNVGKEQKFGFWSLQGSTDQTDKGGLKALTFAGSNTPTSDEILDNKDKTQQYGAFYVFDDGTWHFDGEIATGKLGRLFASVNGAAGAAKRESLDQKFLGYYATAAYTTGANTFAVRYDLMNYNQGNHWYTAYNPYTESAPGVSRGDDYSPKYTEITAGYTYAFDPKVIKHANLKINYIHRSKNFLAPSAALGETGAQGGDSAVVAFQIAF
ncbi:MAG TPA: hypothetical protein VL181_09595 [Holophagaceae bacterium]|jgi:hypothetical protein|nr:hypothetical protein [Holophagaceae bacterium]